MLGAKKRVRITHLLVFLLATIALAAHFSPAAASSSAFATDLPPAASSDDAPAAPSIASQPASQTITPGASATFVVVATGTAPISYQWMLNGEPIAGATSASFTTPAATTEDAGSHYSVRISNAVGTITSSSATLTVDAAAQTERPAASTLAHERGAPSSRFLSGSYFGINIGSIRYAFSNIQLLPGFQAQTVQVPHLTARFILFGHEFNKYISGQVSEMVNVHGVNYRNVNGDMAVHNLWMNNVAGFTVKARLPLGNRWSLYGEGGLGVVARNGFTVNQQTALNGTNYATFLYGGGVDYRLRDNWDLLTGVVVAPGHEPGNQPAATFASGGFDYTMRRIDVQPAESETPDAPMWPKNFIQVGFITGGLGYDVNDFFTTGKVRIFWHGTVDVESGLSVDYERNLFHTRRFFALDWGVSISTFRSRTDSDWFFTASLYPVLRIPIVRTNPAEFYVSYSLAGPAFISRTNLDGVDTGKHFTFQDYMAVGSYIGRKRKLTTEVRIGHYSNANMFLQNPGITIPLSFFFGTTF